jgi:MFS family permease
MYQSSFFRFIIWASITLFYCYQYILRLLPNMIMPELMKTFSINAKEIGLFAGIYYIGYITMYIPLGILLSRFGSKKILPVCIGLSSIGLLPMMYSTSWTLVVLGRFFIGVCSSAAIIGAFQSFCALFAERFSLVLGSTVCIGILTAINISKPLLFVRDSVGMSSMLMYLCIGGIILAFFPGSFYQKKNDLNVKVVCKW